MADKQKDITATNHEDRPFWWPDTKGWIVIGLFVIFNVSMFLAAFFPSLKENQLFTSQAQAIINLLGLAVGYFVGSSQGAKEANTRADKAMDVLSNNAASTGNGGLNIQPPAVVTIISGDADLSTIDIDTLKKYLDTAGIIYPTDANQSDLADLVRSDMAAKKSVAAST